VLKPPTWTDCIPRTEHNAIFLDCDYSSSTLGPKSEWGPSLRAYTTMAFADSRGACIYWGLNKVAIYNENFAVTAGKAHPLLMGRGFDEAFPELTQAIAPVFAAATEYGAAVDVGDIELFVQRNGYTEEAYFVGQFIPLRGDSGEVEGFYNTVLESTMRVIHERRRKVADLISSSIPRSVEDVFTLFFDALRTNPRDITAAMLYTLDDSTAPSMDNLHLRGTIGVPDGHPCALAHARLESGQRGLIPLFRHVKATGKPYVLNLDKEDPFVPQGLFDGIEWQGFGEPSHTVVVFPVPTSGDIVGFYVQGTNPRRLYDPVSERSIRDKVTQMVSKWAASESKEQAYLREKALERRATDSENRLKVLAIHAPLGMYQVGPDSNIEWANDQFYEITGHDRTKPAMVDFRETLAVEERVKELALSEQMLSGATTTRVVREIRLNRKWIPPVDASRTSEPADAWILAVTFPLRDDGETKMLFGYVTDISRQKWAEDVQTRAAVKAEAFLDVTSHELRNPLTAIIQLADSIAKSMEVKPEHGLRNYRDIAQESAEAAATILACAAHQKRIIDDVLVLSRLDSQMLSITPTTASPSVVIDNTLKIFEGVAAQKGIKLAAGRVNDALDVRHVNHVFVDTTRLMQVIINMISNAIKFTAARPKREISVVYGVRAHRPSHFETPFGDLKWVPFGDQKANPSKLDATLLPPKKPDEKQTYVYFLVQDTGPGLSPAEIQRLFQRFSQATTKTNVTYGGSGLGLYICRELAEKQGGRVGVASKEGEGSVFGFYLETKAMNVPVEQATTPSKTIGAAMLQPREGIHVLLVEDNLINQRVLMKQLQRAKCTVAVANQGFEALAILEKRGCWQEKISNGGGLQNGERTKALPVDVVLMDIEMPVSLIHLPLFPNLQHRLTLLFLLFPHRSWMESNARGGSESSKSSTASASTDVYPSSL
jgi:signal transduction histidine kinase